MTARAVYRVTGFVALAIGLVGVCFGSPWSEWSYQLYAGVELVELIESYVPYFPFVPFFPLFVMIFGAFALVKSRL